MKPGGYTSEEWDRMVSDAFATVQAAKARFADYEREHAEQAAAAPGESETPRVPQPRQPKDLRFGIQGLRAEKCFHCQKPITEGQETAHAAIRLYHRTCWENLNA